MSVYRIGGGPWSGDLAPANQDLSEGYSQEVRASASKPARRMIAETLWHTGPKAKEGFRMNGCGPFRPALFMSCLMAVSCANSAAQKSSDSKIPPFNLQLTDNRVLVPVVVRDAHGHSVRDLVKEDFKVFDNGKPHPVSGFMVETREPAQISTESP